MTEQGKKNEATLVEQTGAGSCLVLKVTGVKSGQASVFMKLKDLYPECEFLIKGADQLYPLFCLRNNVCPRNANCMEKLAKRVKYVFDTFPDSEILYLYFRYPDRPHSQRAGVFCRDLSNPEFPKYVTFNRSQWVKMKEIGTVYKWDLPRLLFLDG